MSWLQLTLQCRPDVAELYSGLLSELGAQAVTMRDGADQPLYEPPPGATPLWNSTLVTGLFAATDDAQTIIDSLSRMSHPQPLPEWSREIIDDQPWERAWMEDFQPMRFAERLWIVPSWMEPPDPDGVNIELDPGLAFGTGTHPTTRLCLEWLDGIAIQGTRVVDYGCGSGILAVAAAKLGAATVLGVDNDHQALLATQENSRRNGVADRITTSLPESYQPIEADTVIANILAGTLEELAPTLASLTRQGGRIALCGILSEQSAELQAFYSEWYEMAEPRHCDGWVLLEGRRK